MYPNAQGSSRQSPKRKSHGFEPASTSDMGQAPNNQGSNIPMGNASYIDMDLLLNNELWRHITPPQQAHAPEAEFTQGVPFQRTFPEAHNMWHGPRHEAVETMHPTHHGLSAPASQSSFVYERAGPSMDRDMAYSLPQQRLNELPPGRPFPSAEANVQSMPTALSNIAHPRPKRFVEEHGVPLVPPDVHPAVGPAPPNFITPWNVQHMRSREGVLPTPSDHGKPYQRRSSGDTPGNASHAWVHSQIRPRTGRSNSEDYVQEQDDSIPSDNDNAEEIDSTPSTLMSSNDSEAKKLLDKRRRRRESHNAVERRRRDNINSQITERTFDPGALTQSLRCYRKPCYSMQLRGNSASWTFGPETAAKVARSRTGLGSWRTIGNEGQAQDPALNQSRGIPKESCLNMPSFTSFASALSPVDANNPALAAAQAKPNKGIILRKSVEYVRQLQQFLDMQMRRNHMLESELRQQYEAKWRESSIASGSNEPVMPFSAPQQQQQQQQQQPASLPMRSQSHLSFPPPSGAARNETETIGTDTSVPQAQPDHSSHDPTMYGMKNDPGESS